MILLVGPTGVIVKGHVLDCAVAPLEQKLKEYDNRLYLKWNPFKKKKQGVWELRRRDENKSVVDWAEFEGNCYTRLEYAENNFVNHILDLPVLDYRVLDKVKDMDTWTKGYGVGNIADQAERNLDHYEAEQKEKNRTEMLYKAKQFKKEFKDLREYVLSGGDPGNIASHWGRGK